jgi:hypothetical protein
MVCLLLSGPARSGEDLPKSPEAAMFLSFVVPGAGQYYNGGEGDLTKGLVMTAGSATGAILFFVGKNRTRDVYPFGRINSQDAGLVLGGLATWGFFHLWSLFDAPGTSERLNRESLAPRGVPGQEAWVPKSPVVAGFFSLVLPGTGQYYNGDTLKGAVMQAGVLGGLGMVIGAMRTELDLDGNALPRNEGLLLAGLATCATSHLWSIIDAPVCAADLNSRMSSEPTAGKGKMSLGIQPFLWAGGADPSVAPGLRMAMEF